MSKRVLQRRHSVTTVVPPILLCMRGISVRPRRFVLALVGMTIVVAGMLVGPGPASADESRGRMVLVLDSSGSMKEPDASGTTKIAAAKTALNTVVDKLPADALVGMRVYGATVFDKSDPKACTDSQLVVPIAAANKPKLKAQIAKYKPYGETPIAYSLLQAAKDLGKDGQRSIVLVSDGEETCNPDPCAVAESIHNQGIDLRIDVVGMSVRGTAQQQLQCIADKGGGSYCETDSPAELIECLGQAALRDFRPFTVSGKPVKGTPQPAGAPVVRPGQYTDRLGGTAEPTGVRYYTIRPQAGSSIHVGFTAYPPSHGGLKGYNDQAGLALTAPDGTECVRYNGLQMYAGTRGMLTSSVSFIPELAEEGSACASPTELTLEIRRGRVETGTIPFEFLIIEEPPLADMAGLPAPVSTDAEPSNNKPVRGGPAKGNIAGGGGFVQAATLGPGTWSDTVQGGEVLFYRIRADWGQAPRATVKLTANKQAAQVIGGYGAYTELKVFGPTRAEIDSGEMTTVTSTKPAVMSTALLPVRYRNREGDYMSDSTPRRSMSLAGYYYFVLTVAKSGPGLGTFGRFQMPVQISVALDGRPNGAPHYKQAEVEPTSASESPTPTDSLNPTVSPSEGGEAGPTPAAGVPAGDGSSGWILPAAAGGGGVIVLFGAVLVGLLLRRSSRMRRGVAHTPAGLPPQGPPPQGRPPYGPPPQGPPPPGGPPRL
jgi:Ca-activated chloride channel family protein